MITVTDNSVQQINAALISFKKDFLRDLKTSETDSSSSDLTKDTSELPTRVDDLSASLDELSDKLDNLSTSVNSLDEVLSDLLSIVQYHSDIIDKLSDRVAALEGNNSNSNVSGYNHDPMGPIDDYGTGTDEGPSH